MKPTKIVIDASKMTLEQRRQLLDSADGRFFEVAFIKADGSLRELTGKKWVGKWLHGKPGENPNPVVHKPNYYTVASMGDEGYRNISLYKLVAVKLNGKTYKFEDEK